MRSIDADREQEQAVELAAAAGMLAADLAELACSGLWVSGWNGRLVAWVEEGGGRAQAFI
jgi:hypothetical protein